MQASPTNTPAEDILHASGTYVAHEITSGYHHDESWAEDVSERKYIVKRWTLYMLGVMTAACAMLESGFELHKEPELFDVSFVFATIIMLLAGMAFLLMTYGLYAQKQYDVFICLVVLATIEAFSAVDYIANPQRRPELKVARLITVFILTTFTVMLAYLTITDEHWKEFRIIGAADGLIEMYCKQCFFMSVLRLDCCAAIMFGFFGLYSTPTSRHVWPIAITISVSTYSLLVWVLGSYSVYREKKAILFVFVCLSMLLFLWVPLQMFHTYKVEASRQEVDTRGLTLLYTALVAGVAVIILRMFVYIEVIKMYKNFGYGLSDRGFALLLSRESTSLLGPH